MNTQKTNYLLGGIILAIILAGVVALPYLPAEVASNWGATGEVNDYMDRLLGVFTFPALLTMMFVFYFIIPKIDPLKDNVEAFRKYYNGFWIFMFGFFAYIFALFLLWNLGVMFDFTIAMIPAMSLLLYVLGVVIEKAKRNWFVGIRNPWTLSSDQVWNKTHKLGGKLFKISAILPLIALFIQEEIIILLAIAAPAIIITLVTTIYSYLLFRQLD